MPLLSPFGGRTAALQRQLQALHRSQAIIEFLPDGRIVAANALFLEMTGYTLDELRGQHHRRLVLPEEADSQAYRDFWARLDHGAPFSGRCARVARDGRTVWLQALYSPVQDRRGQVTRIVKYATDITAEVERDTAMQGQLAAIDRSQGLIEFALDGTILEANENFLQTVGYRRDEVVGRHHRMFVVPQLHTSPEYTQFWQRLAAGQYQRGQFHRIGKGGRDVWIEASYNPVLDSAGLPVKVVKYASDITARFEANRMLQDSFEALCELVSDSARQAEAAQQQTSRVAAVADDGSGVARRAVDAMTAANAGSRRMADIVGIIDAIAFQTNLLALNAAVEAARAGDQGRGFAVVAGEVRMLAQRSSEAAREIKQLIGDSTTQVEGGYGHVQSTDRMMQEIRSAAQQASELMGHILAASQKQESRIGVVNTALRQLDATLQG